MPEQKASPVDDEVKTENTDMQVDQDDKVKTTSASVTNDAEATMDERQEDTDVEMQEAVKTEVTQPATPSTPPAVAVDNNPSSTTARSDAPTAAVSVESPTRPNEPQTLLSTPEADARAAANEKEAPVHEEKPVENGAVEEELDDGEMSDASSASTIPLDDDERKARQEELARPMSPFRDNAPHEEETAAATEMETANETETIKATGTVAEANVTTNTEAETEAEPQSAAEEGAEPTPSSSPSKDSSSENRPPLASKPSPSDASSSTIDTGSEGKPVKVKLSLQEYLSRRAANQSLSVPDKEKDDPSTSTSTTGADHPPPPVQGSVCNGLPVSDSPMDKEQQPSEAIVNQH
ncbi:hypothetical protein BCR43DRAFT_498929 [Syncephalastrum racemosum]|uniref:Uncharacterized protein n=1 Tax=Syncephalastrum racemosum TaxID=13706 RepID=A0A1X2H1P7_SYNRA|nr:hypothetical protein BCR43DRAFT_498929 [Syncephalastrum racemosum]